MARTLGPVRARDTVDLGERRECGHRRVRRPRTLTVPLGCVTDGVLFSTGLGRNDGPRSCGALDVDGRALVPFAASTRRLRSRTRASPPALIGTLSKLPRAAPFAE